jgi:hypothetical protein
MKKLIVLACTFFLALTVAGCGGDQRADLIGRVLTNVNKASTSMTTIKENLEKLDKEKKDTDKAALVKKAIEGTNTLAAAAKELHQIKQESLTIEPASKEQIEEYRDKQRDAIRAAVKRVSEAQTAMNAALVHAEKNHPDQKNGLTELRQKLHVAQAEFELQVKQQ